MAQVPHVGSFHICAFDLFLLDLGDVLALPICDIVFSSIAFISVFDFAFATWLLKTTSRSIPRASQQLNLTDHHQEPLVEKRTYKNARLLCHLFTVPSIIVSICIVGVFCTADAFHIKIRNGCSDQVCYSCLRQGAMSPSGNTSLGRTVMDGEEST